jgi:Leucine-rich repeat (LRR) protein
MRQLKTLNKLQKLYLQETKLTDEGLKPLSGLPRLEALDLEKTEVTDEGIKELRELKELQTLDLSQTNVRVLETGNYLFSQEPSWMPAPKRRSQWRFGNA